MAVRRAFLLAWAALLLSVVNDSWAITAFNVDIGPFSDSRSWDNGVPTVSNIGWVNNGGTATGGDEIIGPFTLLIDDGAVDFELPKLQGVNIAQAGGSWSSSDSTILGWDVVHDQDTHDPAIYALHAEFSAGNELVIGRNANATMDHQNGTVTVTNALRIGSVANSARSTYSITDGTVTAGDLIFGPSSVDGRISPSFNFVERSAGKLNVLNSNYSEQDGLDDIVAGNITGENLRVSVIDLPGNTLFTQISDGAIGDMDWDRDVDFDDINDFVLGLNNPVGYVLMFGASAGNETAS